MDDRDPRILPGPTAYTVNRRAQYLLIASFAMLGFLSLGTIALQAFSEVARKLSWIDESPVIAFALVFAYFGALAAFSIATSRAARIQDAEVEAGYTTILDRFDQVDGIDPKTRAVVRPAKVRGERARRPNAISTGAGLGELVGVQTPLQIAIALRLPAIGFSVATALLLTGIAMLVAMRLGGDVDVVVEVLAVLCLPVSLGAVLSIPYLILNVIAPRRTLAVVAAHFPDAQVYVGELADGDVVTELLDAGAARLPGAEYRSTTYFVFDAEHLTMYSQHRNHLVPFLAIPRARVSAGRTAYVRNGSAAPALTVEKNNGGFVDLIILLGGRSGLLTDKELVAASNRVAAWRTGTY